MRLIDADVLKPDYIIPSSSTNTLCTRLVSLQQILIAPTIDAVPVVRCKDCKHYREGKVLSPQKFCFRLIGKGGETIGYNFAEDDFCSYGERSEDATD